MLAEVKRTVAQERPRSCARTSSLKVTCVLLVLLGTVSHLLITITQARPSSAITSASLQQDGYAFLAQSFRNCFADFNSGCTLKHGTATLSDFHAGSALLCEQQCRPKHKN